MKKCIEREKEERRIAGPLIIVIIAKYVDGISLTSNALEGLDFG